jgi:hypothetical protein
METVMATSQNSRIDFAPHQLEVSKKMREINEKLLKNNYKEAASLVDYTVAELRLMRAAINSHVS